MKKCKILMFAVVAIAIAAFNVRIVLNSNRSYDLNMTTITAISGEDEPVDGGETGEVEIKCDTGGSGKCYKMGYQEGLYGVCYFFCTATGNTSDYCSSVYVNLVNFCTIIGGV